MVLKVLPMMLIIGNNQGIGDRGQGTEKRKLNPEPRTLNHIRAFTLVEIMLAVTILSLGIVGILRAYATSINVLEIGQDNIDAVTMLKEKMAEIEQKFLEEGTLLPGTSSGVFDGEFEGYQWEWEIKPSTLENLSEVILIVSSKDKPRKFSLQTYMVNVEKKEEE
jgi:Tfp pilus assembly protein PilE